MKNKIVRVLPMPDSVPIGAEYSVSSYKSPGLYVRPGVPTSYLFDGACVFCVSGVDKIAENEPESPAAGAPSGISEPTLLKALAICLNPSAHTAQEVA